MEKELLTFICYLFVKHFSLYRNKDKENNSSNTIKNRESRDSNIMILYSYRNEVGRYRLHTYICIYILSLALYLDNDNSIQY